MAIKLNPFSTDQLSTLLMGETAGKEKIIGAKDTEYTDFRGQFLLLMPKQGLKE